MPPDLTRVLIAEDSPTIRHHLTAIIDAAPGLTVAGIAGDGEAALALADELQPDVVSMDVQMPKLDGLSATRRLMQTAPRPVVVVSGLLERDIDLSFKALEAGALAVAPKPGARHTAQFDQQQQQLTNTLRAMAGVRVVRRWAVSQPATAPPTDSLLPPTERPRPLLIAIAASAGGPGALAALLAHLHRPPPVPIVVVQHMPDEFIEGLARWLERLTQLPVRLAFHNQPLAPGMVHLASGRAHLRVQRGGRHLFAQRDEARGDYAYQPAADVLFESVALALGARSVGIVLTGMGADGAAGLLHMHAAGAHTFAQDEASSIVFGMPAAAIRLGAVERVMAPAQLAATLSRLL